MNRQSGLGLIEVLIALVVISVGLLGIASLQAMSVSRAHSSNVQGLAAVQAQNIVARMLANPEALSADGLSVAYALSQSDSFPTNARDCTQNVCSPNEMAKYDLQVWGEQLKRILPSGDGWIECPQTDPPECTVTVFWKQKQMDPSTGNSNPVLKEREYSIVVQL